MTSRCGANDDITFFDEGIDLVNPSTARSCTLRVSRVSNKKRRGPWSSSSSGPSARPYPPKPM
jgi:hypothetical protein